MSHVVVADLAGAARLPWLRRRVDTMKQGAWANHMGCFMLFFVFGTCSPKPYSQTNCFCALAQDLEKGVV